VNIPDPEFDAHGYPTEATLDVIRNWPWQDFDGLRDFIKRLGATQNLLKLGPNLWN
jgi:hypothetical protein